MPASDDNDKTNDRRLKDVAAERQVDKAFPASSQEKSPAVGDSDFGAPTRIAPGGSEASRSVPAVTPPVKSPGAAGDGQLTQYSVHHSHSAGFAQARELVAQSMSSGMLLKKRFLLEEVLGEGGMGTVYKTKDLRKVEAEDPNPYIATKVLNSAFKDHPDAFVTLQQEAAKSQTLAHPNIVTVHDFDRDGDTLYMTMELLEGEPLDKLLKARRNKGLPKPQVLTITRDLCAALSYAHQRQLIHADFKPGNIYVTRDGHAKVLDFGIARAASKESQKHKFDAGQLGALTPAYATIEMVKDEPISYSDDVYALACVVYEMLTGRHPYNNRSALEACQQKQKPARPEVLTAREWKALSHALALEKAARTPDIQAFVRELFPRRGAMLMRAALGVAAVSLLGAGWFGFQQYQEQLDNARLVAEKLTAAQQCFARSDFTCAIEQSLVAVSLDPENTAAAQLLDAAQQAKQYRADEEKVISLLAEANRCLSEGDATCVQVKARDVLALSEDNLAARTLLDTATRQLQHQAIEQLVLQADNCLAQDDLSCAELFSAKAKDIDGSNPASLALTQRVQARQEALRAQQETRAQQVQRGLGEANQCFMRKDYLCTLAASEKVLAIEPANTQAIELRQSASLARQQARELAQKVDKLLVDANACMEKKNYSCAIAKAESALDLAPGHRQALALKQSAQETQRKLKESGFNIQ
ncbi:serine/threonine-protein kinase [Cellvibrio japonicus]|uniref:Serine/threonine kinase n=1 Tax=Cellvibrio japonicus (strain Ueda107) TaxID=498211 RepID=B3PKU7_CELJU|nr:serine/threonine-protein kinase [Cellvibrio japonicus]ACE84766.1 serine/threonine kinase [Cellvibrio japonicus Ueda107]